MVCLPEEAQVICSSDPFIARPAFNGGLQTPELFIVACCNIPPHGEVCPPHFERISMVYAVFFFSPFNEKGAGPQFATMVLSLGSKDAQYRISYCSAPGTLAQSRINSVEVCGGFNHKAPGAAHCVKIGCEITRKPKIAPAVRR